MSQFLLAYKNGIQAFKFLFVMGNFTSIPLPIALGLTFLFSYVTSPWSLGLTYFLIFALFYECCYYGASTCSRGWLTWSWKDRALVVLASFLGWLFGSWAMGKEAFDMRTSKKSRPCAKKMIEDLEGWDD